MTDARVVSRAIGAGVGVTVIAIVASSLQAMPADVAGIDPGLASPPAIVGVAMVVFGLVGMGVIIGGGRR